MKIKKNKPKIYGRGSVFIDDSATFGENVVIYQNNIIKGNTKIGDNVVIKPNNYIENCTIGAGSVIDYSYMQDSIVGENVSVGPFSRLRPNSRVGDNCKVGNFVEIKNSTLGKGSKASHLAYIGDTDMGDNCNVGCGAIFVNYNGKTKSHSHIGNNCFIGSNVNVIAPVNIASETYICAGTTVTTDTLPYDFVIGRTRETVKHDYAKKYKKESK